MTQSREPNSSSPDHNSQITNHKSFLFLDHLEKHFGSLHVTADVSLEVAQREIVALLGPSGSGKTTLLRLLAGFETLDSGRIAVGDEDVTATPAERRRFGMVFQHYALFPHMTVGENVAFGLESQGVHRPDAARRVGETLAAVDLAGFQTRRVTELSGGQQQRVALARALAPRPQILLLDEPLSNLDPSLRERTRRELKRIIRAVGITTLFVTHEQEEAFELGDRIAVLNRGHLEQIGSAEELYENPASRFVASFVGRSSQIPGIWEGPIRVRLPGGVYWAAVETTRLLAGTPVDVLVRPEGLAFSDRDSPLGLEGEVIERRYAGRGSFFVVQLYGASEVEVLADSRAARLGQKVSVVPAPGGPAPRVYSKEAT
jgi:putative spermidine/putrescine transport system ATP-binding protein